MGGVAEQHPQDRKHKREPQGGLGFPKASGVLNYKTTEMLPFYIIRLQGL